MNSESHPHFRQNQTQREEQQTELKAQSEAQSRKTFESVEELIRFDVEQTTAPEGIATRVNESIEQSALETPWWRRLLGG